MPNSKVLSVLDTNSGFWQIKLDDESAKLCTFNTPFGRYMFKRLSFGLSSAQDVFQDIMSEMFEDIEGVEVIVDDLLIWGETEKQHNTRLRHVWNVHNIATSNSTKTKAKSGMMSYIGHTLSKDG